MKTIHRRCEVPWHRVQRIGIISVVSFATAVYALQAGAADVASDAGKSGAQEILLDTWNGDAVKQPPVAKAEFRIDKPYLLTYVYTYHWNFGWGRPRPGTISLQHEDGTVYGPWAAGGRAGDGEVPNAAWECRPNVIIKPGRYVVVDSDPKTWSQNERSGGRGVTKVMGVLQDGAPVPAKAVDGGLALHAQHRYDEAIAVFTGLIDQNPGNSEAWRLRGISKTSKRDYTGAIADLDKAISLKHDAASYLARAHAKELSGDFKGASEDYAWANPVSSAEVAAAEAKAKANADNTPSDFLRPPESTDNVALAKEGNLARYSFCVTTQSSVLNGQIADYGPQVGTDGVTTDEKVTGFFHTMEENAPWWQVDLAGVHKLQQIRLFNRTVMCGERANTIQVKLSVDGKDWETVYRHDGTVWKTLNIAVKDKRARFVRVQLNEKNSLHLDEVEVYGVAAIDEKPAPPGPKKGVARTRPVTLPAASNVPKGNIAPFLDVNKLSATQWAGSVSAAMEAMRLVQGPMTEEQNRSFEAAWAPMFNFPCSEVVDWLNQLNPLLGQFLAIRAAMADTAIQFDVAWKEATTSAALHNERAAGEALSIAHGEQQTLANLQQQLTQVIANIQALGDPPNADYHRSKKRKEFERMIKDTGEPELGRWVLVDRWDTPKAEAKAERRGNGFIASHMVTCSMGETNAVALRECRGKGDAWDKEGRRQEKTIFHRQRVALSWSPPPDFLEVGSDLMSKFACKTETIETTVEGDLDPNYEGVQDSLVILEMGYYRITGSPPEIKAQASASSAFGNYGLNADTVIDSNQLQVRSSFGSVKGREHVTKLDYKVIEVAPGHKAGVVGPEHRLIVLSITVLSNQGGYDSACPGACCRFWLYDWDPTGQQEPAKIEPVTDVSPTTPSQPDNAPAPDASQTPPPGPAKAPEPQRDLEDIANEYASRAENIKIMQRNMERDREDLDRETKDPARRQELLNRILGAQANIQAEQDLMNSLETGQFVHTRTAWDEVQHTQFVQNCQAEVNEMAARDRYRVGMFRMIGQGNPQDADRLRDFVLNSTDPTSDSAELKKVAHIVYNAVEGHLEGQAARSKEEAATADRKLQYLETVKSVCDKGMFLGALCGGHSVMVAYEGVIGYVEGPPPKPGREEQPTDASTGARIFEGLKRAGAWYSTATYVASEAVEGYQSGGYIGGEKGVKGAVERAAEAFVMAKGMEYGIGKLFGGGPPAGELPPRPTVKEQFELAKYRQERDFGKSLVDDYQRTMAEYRRIQEFGGSAAEISAMEEQLRTKAASMHSSFEAKLSLKEMYSKAEGADMLTDYVFRVGQNHDLVREQWFRRMESMGYDDVRHWELWEVRNSSSAGSPGMDHDMGIVDAGQKFYKREPGYYPSRVSPRTMNEDAQEAWNKAYQETTGYSAKQSFETVTTSVHKEAYHDRAWLGEEATKKVKVYEIFPEWAGQAADVTAVKSYDMFKDLPRLQAMVEAGRGTAKDIETKLLPVLEASAKRNPKSADRILHGYTDKDTGERVEGYVTRWKEIRDILKTVADNPIEADRKMRLTTGKSIYEIAHDYRDMAASHGRAINAPAAGAPKMLGRKSTANPAKGRFVPRDIREQLAVEQAMHDAKAGEVLPLEMKDPTWPAEEGWKKMKQRIESGGRPIEVHYVYNPRTKEMDDFKIVDEASKTK